MTKYAHVSPDNQTVTKLSNKSVIKHFEEEHGLKVNQAWLSSVDTIPYNIYTLEYEPPTLLDFQDIGSLTYDVQSDKVVESSTVVDMSVSAAKDVLKARLAGFRYNIEVGGIVLQNGVAIDTDRATRPNLTAEYMLATSDQNHTVVWKAGDNFVTLDADTIISIALAARNHVADCFRREGVVAGVIEDCTTLDELRDLNLSTEWDAAAS
jgi:hypothetical protein